MGRARRVADRYVVEVKTVAVKVRDGFPPPDAVRSTRDAARLVQALLQNLDQDQEHFLVLALDARNRPTGFRVVASGGMSDSQVDIRLVFRSALLLGGTHVIVAHNHPSGDPEPSASDLALTRSLVISGEVTGIPVLDHIVVGGRRWVSLRERGLI